ncbi:hypothetical protein RRG08_021550 [Elysia crispata]|uniref:Uncharacterized protein n=1 Tax=Elysia crispata TaxID=231223 RepID=A0AAE1CEQ5_9GAST|nr:hypothetical protein RRG08_021550 [Elysia crispata]
MQSFILLSGSMKGMGRCDSYSGMMSLRAGSILHIDAIYSCSLDERALLSLSVSGGQGGFSGAHSQNPLLHLWLSFM